MKSSSTLICCGLIAILVSGCSLPKRKSSRFGEPHVCTANCAQRHLTGRQKPMANTPVSLEAEHGQGCDCSSCVNPQPLANQVRQQLKTSSANTPFAIEEAVPYRDTQIRPEALKKAKAPLSQVSSSRLLPPGKTEPAISIDDQPPKSTPRHTPPSTPKSTPPGSIFEPIETVPVTSVNQAPPAARDIARANEPGNILGIEELDPTNALAKADALNILPESEAIPPQVSEEVKKSLEMDPDAFLDAKMESALKTAFASPSRPAENSAGTGDSDSDFELPFQTPASDTAKANPISDASDLDRTAPMVINTSPPAGPKTQPLQSGQTPGKLSSTEKTVDAVEKPLTQPVSTDSVHSDFNPSRMVPNPGESSILQFEELIVPPKRKTGIPTDADDFSINNDFWTPNRPSIELPKHTPTLQIVDGQVVPVPGDAAAARRTFVPREPAIDVATSRPPVDPMPAPLVLKARTTFAPGPNGESDFLRNITRGAQIRHQARTIETTVPTDSKQEDESIYFSELPTMHYARSPQPLIRQQSYVQDPQQPQRPANPTGQPNHNAGPTLPAQPVSQHNLAPISGRHQSLGDRPVMIQASSARVLDATSKSAAATGMFVGQQPFGAPSVAGDGEMIRLKAIIGGNHLIQLPPVINLRMEGVQSPWQSEGQAINAPIIFPNNDHQQMLQTNDVPGGHEFLPPEIPTDLRDLPKIENAPMIDFHQVDERIRRLTVRPESPPSDSRSTIDR